MSSKKVLIITYYWPPAGGPGVQRWLKFVKYLPQYDVEPIVYCPSNPSYPVVDSSLKEEIPEGIEVLSQPIREPYRLASLFSRKSTKDISSGIIPKAKRQTFIEKFLLFIRGNYFIPDARVNWVKPSITFLSQYISQNAIDSIITTGPPHSLHLIGLGLKEQIGVKWIADFRDPWTTIGYHKALKLRRKGKEKHIQLEKNVLSNADEIIVTSHFTKKEFSTKTNVPITVITNGYDNHHVSIDKKDAKFTLSHIGSLLSERNPIVLWRVLSKLIETHSEFAKHFRLNLVGIVSNDILDSIKSNGLEEFVTVVGYVNHDEAIAYQMKSRLLLLIEIDSEDTKAIIPGKLFEYMISETPILAIGPDGSDVEMIIKSTNTGRYFNYQNQQELEAQLLTYFEAYKNDSLNVNAIGLQPYSRKELTKSLSTIIKEL
ncbi:glycosyltransferase [Winogradskyella poriferorum]|uniref:glycosyltransferase n=1 Tax=Winogradskyella poriferorum TaxID=307627 RepID=UPI003D6607C2